MAALSPSPDEFNLCGFALLEHDSLLGATSHARSLELFRDSVVRPSLRALDAEIARLDGSDEPGAEFFSSDLGELFQASVEGYLLTVQSMWERGLRGMLVERERRLCAGQAEAKLQRAVWRDTKGGDLHDHFQRLVGFPITHFDAYGDLDFLQCLASAIRHGDGPSARRVHELCPGLWWDWIDPSKPFVAGPFRIEPSDGTRHPSFSAITLPEALLGQMMQAALWFWEDVDNLRCMSFHNRHHTVVTRLDDWPAERAQRESRRVWSAAKPLA
jgi:hypothetical protein